MQQQQNEQMIATHQQLAAAVILPQPSRVIQLNTKHLLYILELESTAVSPIEPSIAELPLLIGNACQVPISYEIESTNKGKQKLIDSN